MEYVLFCILHRFIHRQKRNSISNDLARVFFIAMQKNARDHYYIPFVYVYLIQDRNQECRLRFSMIHTTT